MKTQRKETEVDSLLKLMASLPKVNTDTTPDEPSKKNAKWRHKSTNTIASKGRVNRTRGK